jgi:hypothetical protein
LIILPRSLRGVAVRETMRSLCEGQFRILNSYVS